jgi:hypothetical protein
MISSIADHKIAPHFLWLVSPSEGRRTLTNAFEFASRIWRLDLY